MNVSADKDARLLLLQDELRYTTYFFPLGFLLSLLPLLGLLNMPSKQKQKGGIWKRTADPGRVSQRSASFKFAMRC